MIESVPNLSEGARRSLVELAAVAAVGAGARVLDVHLDADHGRAVVTAVGGEEEIAGAMVALTRAAIERIDLRRHVGVHPRIGAVDVIPFVPLHGATMTDCDRIARSVAERIAREHEIPIFLYGASATAGERRALATLRRGGLEGLAAWMRCREGRPDYGPSRLHPTAGAMAVGARSPLVAFNVILESEDLGLARRIAGEIRESSGGLRGVQAMGVRLASRRAVQVSMNLTDLDAITVPVAFERVRSAAERAGTRVRESEIVGLVPRSALAGATADGIRFQGPLDERILENRLVQVGRLCL